MNTLTVRKENGDEMEMGTGPDGYVYLYDGETVIANPHGLKVYDSEAKGKFIRSFSQLAISGIIAALIIIVISKYS